MAANNFGGDSGRSYSAVPAARLTAVATAGMSGFPTIGFGPGHEEYAHAPNEQVEVEHLVRASAFYVALVDEFAKTPNEETTR